MATKALLLPLSTVCVRQLSLRQHLALSVLHNGRGSGDQIVTLINTLYLAYCLHHEESALYVQAETALRQCILRSEGEQRWILTDAEYETLKSLVVLHDTQLAEVTMRRYLEVSEKVERMIANGAPSPIRVPGRASTIVRPERA